MILYYHAKARRENAFQFESETVGFAKKYNKITPEGTKDLLFEECLARRYVEQTLSQVFSSRGFNEVVTPGLEFYDVFDPDFSVLARDHV